MFTSFLVLLWGLVSLPVVIVVAITKLAISKEQDKEVRVVETVTTKGGVVTRTIRRSFKA